MEQNDQIKEFFKQRLSDHQEVVRPEIWAAVSSAIATPVLVTTGLSVISKAVIGVGIAATVLVSAYLLYSSDDKAVKVPTQDKKNAKEVPFIPTNNNKLVPIETIKKIIPIFERENNDIMTILEVAQVDQDLPTIPVESVEITNPVPLQDLIEITSPEVVKNEMVAPPKATNEPHILPEKEELFEVVLSNIFTPNGDGANDYLVIQSEGLQDFSVVILNQANKIIYQSTDSKFSWDGKLASGDDAPAGNYIYFVTAKSPTGKPIQQSSSLFIQR
jgi:gliding motility-associated-like protein